MNDSLVLQVEPFADLMIQIDDPFGAREPALASAGLDEHGYRNLVEAWRVRFDRDVTGALAARFAEAYAARRAALFEARRRAQSGEAPPKDPRFLNPDAQSFREEAAKVAREPLADVPPEVRSPEPPPQGLARPPRSLSGTADIGAVVPCEPLPFNARATEVRSLVREPQQGIARPARSLADTLDVGAVVPRGPLPFNARATEVLPPEPAPQQSLADTLDIGDFVPRPSTPFAAPPPAVAAPRRRLIRFDPQTGQPLPAPIWVDLPPEAAEQKIPQPMPPQERG